MQIDEGYYEAIAERTEDCDYGSCTGYVVKGEHGQTPFIVYLYDKHPTMISIHEEEASDEQ